MEAQVAYSVVSLPEHLMTGITSEWEKICTKYNSILDRHVIISNLISHMLARHSELLTRETPSLEKFTAFGMVVILKNTPIGGFCYTLHFLCEPS